MDTTGSGIEPYPNAVKAKLLNDGIAKFPVNIHAIYVQKNATSGWTTITIRQNDVKLRFVIDEEACRHLAGLLSGEASKAMG